MNNIKQLIENLHAGDKKSLARCISLVENEVEGYEEILTSLAFKKTVPVIGITGPPGGGKSTFINALIKSLVAQDKKIAVIAVDPTSPFNYGSLLGDRLRMNEHFNNSNVFIRSLATRGSLGGLSAKALEIVDLVRASDFDYILIETVGVGQSEVEIAGLADTTIVLLVPEAGDEIQAIKSGIMEIADIFVVNKSDRPGADAFLNNLQQLVHSRKPYSWDVPVIKTIATQDIGIHEVIEKINQHAGVSVNDKKQFLQTERAIRIIQAYKMKNVDKKQLQLHLFEAMKEQKFNLYSFVKSWIVQQHL